MALFKRGEMWWYKFYFAGQLIRESAKSSSKTVAKNAEEQRRRELEAGFHNLREVRQQRIRRLDEIVDEYLVGYRLRYRSAAFAEYALGHVSRLLGPEMIVDIDEAAALRYQEQRLREKAAPKTSTKLPRRQLRGAISAEDATGFRGDHSGKNAQEKAVEVSSTQEDRKGIRN